MYKIITCGYALQYRFTISSKLFFTQQLTVYLVLIIKNVYFMLQPLLLKLTVPDSVFFFLVAYRTCEHLVGCTRE